MYTDELSKYDSHYNIEEELKFPNHKPKPINHLELLATNYTYRKSYYLIVNFWKAHFYERNALKYFPQDLMSKAEKLILEPSK